MNIKLSSHFRKDLKRYRHREDMLQAVYEVLRHLKEEGKVPAKYVPHPLKGRFIGCMECHVKGDLLLIWMDEDGQTARLMRLGTHHEILGL